MTVKKLDCAIALVVSLCLAGAASAGPKDSTPIKALFAIASTAAAGVTIEWLSRFDRQDAMEQLTHQVTVERQQVYYQAELEADRAVAQYRAADKMMQDNPDLVDYFIPPAIEVHATTVQPDRDDIDDLNDDGTVATVTRKGLFEWEALQDADEHPILAIISPMGGGKSRLAKYLAKHILYPNEEPTITVFDIYGRLTEWKGCALVSDHSQMLSTMKEQLDHITEAIAEYRDGKAKFAPRFTIFEEAPGTLPSLKEKNGKRVNLWLEQYSTVTRKVRDRLCLISVRMTGASIGTGAEARDDCTVIFAGKRGCNKAMNDTRIFKLGCKQNQALRERLRAQLKGIAHPALIHQDGNWSAAQIPELDSHGNPMNGDAVDDEPEPLETCDDISDELAELPRELQPIAQYIQERKSINSRQLKNTFGRNHNLTSDMVNNQLIQLIEWDLIEIKDNVITWRSE